MYILHFKTLKRNITTYIYKYTHFWTRWIHFGSWVYKNVLKRRHNFGCGYISAPGGYISAPGGYISAPGGYISAPGGYISAPGGYISAPGGYISAPGGYI